MAEKGLGMVQVAGHGTEPKCLTLIVDGFPCRSWFFAAFGTGTLYYGVLVL